LLVSFMALGGATQERNRSPRTNPKKEVGRFLAKASGKSPVIPDSNWWDDQMRDFFRSVIGRKQALFPGNP
ncbi:MAG TPA: hypothetical protein VF748_17125, partial [Candidatus Acidoferrum sp.]